jgi:hypothetical protein
MTLHQLNLELAIVDSALSELEERRTAIIHRIGSFTSSKDHRSGALRFPNAITVAAYSEAVHVWSAASNSIHIEDSSLPNLVEGKPTTANSKSWPSKKSDAGSI